MREYFELDPTGKKQEWYLLILAILFCLTIAAGIYCQEHQKDHDNILVPLFFILGGCFFLVYGINAFTKENLTQKWTPAYIFKILLFLAKRFTSSPEKNAKRMVVRFLGISALMISTVSFVTAIISIVRNF